MHSRRATSRFENRLANLEVRLAGCGYAALWMTAFALSAGLYGQPVENTALKLLYRVEWRLWHAGDIRLSYLPPATPKQPWQAEVTLKTRGFVDTLYRVDNHYSVSFNEEFCAQASEFHVSEGKKKRRITVNFHQPPGRATYLERDLVRDSIVNTKVIDVPSCVHDELAALARLRAMRLEPGQSVELPISNGKKFVSARVEAQQRETIKTSNGVHQTIRYEAFLFNNVLYRRDGRLFLWLTDDERRLPVQIQVRLGLYIGTVTLRLVEEERS